MDYSVIIPAYNEELFIGQTLERLRSIRKELSGTFSGEIIVVDNNSTDLTAQIASNMDAHVVFEKVNCIARARNAGAVAAEGKHLIFVDADTLVTTELINSALKHLSTGKICGGGTRFTFDISSISLFARVSLWIWNIITRFKPLAAGSFIFCSRSAWLESGGFNEKLYASEEIFFSHKISKWGKKRGQKFIILDIPAITSGRKFDWYTPRQILWYFLIILVFPFALRNKRFCKLWYDSPEKRSGSPRQK